MKIRQKRVVIVGGSSGIGFAIAKAALSQGAKVVIGSRSEHKLLEAKKKLNDKVETHTIDINDENSIRDFFSNTQAIDHLHITASEIKFGSFRDLSIQEAQAIYDSKFWGTYRVIKFGLSHLQKNASITLYSGSAAQAPEVGNEVLTSVCAALEGLSKNLAKTLAPIRVNAIAPGLIDTELYKHIDQSDKKSLFENFSQKLLIKRAGHPCEVASAALYLMSNDYVSGTLMPVSGGH